MTFARSGSFGGGLNPFGTGSLGGFSQYDIASNLAELEVYRVEVAWGNGTATDDEYLAALKKALDTTSPETRERESAQNRLDDANYRIGRSKADLQGLDALIAFDQAALAKMNPDNLRYRDVKESLDAEQAQRRSRDYGKLVTEYNAGKLSTQKLVDWVAAALQTIDADDPDFNNWTSTRDELAQRVKSEHDEKVFQDYQMGRMKGPDFVAYIANRQQEFSQESPEYADWGRRLEDAKKSVKDAEQQKKDQAFFNAYEEGHKSDKAYIGYLRDRIRGMESDDPDKASWLHRLREAKFSLAEDQLRFDVERGKASVGRLVRFYKDYQRTLNPGSQEWRTIARALRSLGSGSAGGGGGGGGGRSSGGSSSGGGSTASSKSKVKLPKVITPKTSLATIVDLLRVDVNGKATTTRAQTKALDLNIDTLQNARQRGDAVWLFQDPRKPGQMVAGQNPDGSPMLDRKGKPVMVPGTAYMPTSDQSYATLLSVKTQMHYDLAAKALAHHDSAGYFYQLKLATNNEDRTRFVGIQSTEQSNKKFYDAASEAIDLAMRTGDWVTAVNLARQLQTKLESELANPMLDETRRSRLEKYAEKLAENPALPQVESRDGGKTWVEVGGAIDYANSTFDGDGNVTSVTLKPGWHFTLDSADTKGKANWGLQYDDVQDGSWEQKHTTVHTTYGGKVVTGEVTVRDAPFNPSVFAKTPEGMVRTDVGGKYITYTDEHGAAVKAYSLDGTTWVRSNTGLAPSLTLDVDLEQKSDSAGTHWVDKHTGEIVLTKNGDGSVTPNKTYFDKNPNAVDFYGMKDLRKRQANLNRIKTTNADGSAREGQFVSGVEERYIYGTRRTGSGGVEVGGPGQYMQVVTTSPSGAINLTGSNDPFQQTKDNNRRGTPARPGGQDSFAYGSNVSSKKALKAPKQTTARKARMLGESAAELIRRPTAAASKGPNVNAYTGFTLPTVKQQLPKDTPDRYDGIGLRNYTGMPSSLKPATTTPAVKSRTAAKVALPPVKKATKAPLPKPKAPTKKKPVLRKPNTTPRKVTTTRKVTTPKRTTTTVRAGRSTAL
jgi:hypothetical protein